MGRRPKIVSGEWEEACAKVRWADLPSELAVLAVESEADVDDDVPEADAEVVLGEAEGCERREPRSAVRVTRRQVSLDRRT